MDRKTFLKRLTAAAIGIVVAKPIIDMLPKTSVTSKEFQIVFTQDWIRKYPLTYQEVVWRDARCIGFLDWVEKEEEIIPAEHYTVGFDPYDPDEEEISPKPQIYESNIMVYERYSQSITQ